MKLIFEPTICLVAESHVDIGGLKKFLDGVGSDWWPDDVTSPDCIPEIAGRLCYMSYDNPRPGGNKAYLDHIKTVGHGSVCEHAAFSFIIEGVSRSLSHELVRHRAGMSYSQASQRFIDESEAEYVVPPLFVDGIRRMVCAGPKDSYAHVNPDDLFLNGEEYYAGRIWLRGVAKSHRSYCELSDLLFGSMSHIQDKTLRRKAAMEAARSVLPNATETKLFVTGNARAWRHFIEQRASRHADAEIRRLALGILVTLQVQAPNLFGDYAIVKTEDAGIVEANTPWGKV